MPNIDITGGKLEGPIYGEHFTSDKRNNPWHRPADIHTVDDGVVAVMKQLSTKKGTYGLLTTLQMGVSVVQAASALLISGIGMGKWTVDTALLLAGPTAHVIQIMADASGIKYQMGLDDAPIPTTAFYHGVSSLETQNVSFAMEAAKGEIKNVQPLSQDLITQAEGLAQDLMGSPANAATDQPKGFAMKPGSVA